MLRYCVISVILSLLLQACPSVTAVAVVCGGQLTDQSGVIISPNFPNSYPDYSRCEWTITVAADQVITLRFQRLDLGRRGDQSCQDYLTFYDGPSQQSPQIDGQYCGYQNESKTANIRIRSTGPNLHIYMNAYSSAQTSSRTGFSASYWAHVCLPYKYDGQDVCTEDCTCKQENTLYCRSLNGSCVCNNGWMGENCTVDINECLDPNRCPDLYSECKNTPGSFECNCKEGLHKNTTGQCEEYIACTLKNCSHVCGVLSEVLREEKCYCPKGMQFASPNSTSCIECKNWRFGDSCSYLSQCSKTNTEFYDKTNGLCSCYSNWTSTDCTQNVNECGLQLQPCNTTHSACYDTYGSYECRCHNGYEIAINQNFCEQCGRTLTQSSGLIASGYYAYTYSRDLIECFWTISVKEGNVISLRFQTFNLYYSDNYAPGIITIYDGQNTSSNSLGVFDGLTYRYQVPQGIIRSSGNEMHIVRVAASNPSGTSYQTRGFTAMYWSHACPNFTYDSNCTTPCSCVKKNTRYCNSTTGECVCQEQWTSRNCSQDVDECTDPLSCPDYSDCYNWDGGFNCTCKPGLNMTANRTCAVTSGGAICQKQKCSHVCGMDLSGKEMCYCPIGMELENNICVACGNMSYGPDCHFTCSCHHNNTATCDVRTGNCTCHTGWTGKDCTEDINECSLNVLNSCQPSPISQCANTLGGYTCQCLEYNGYEASNNGTCVPIKCDETLISRSGNFTSPKYPLKYFNNARCSWFITVAEGNVISLRFSQFETESNWDYVDIYNGFNTSAPLLGHYSGSDIPTVTRSTGNHMYAVFTSDPSNVHYGFNAIYTSHSCPEFTYGDETCDQPCPCNKNNTQYCLSTTGRCLCKDGWMGNNCTQDVNECLGTNNKNLCPPESYCINTIGSYECDCNTGFFFNASSGICEEIQDCVQKKCSHACTANPDGSEECWCPDGLQLNDIDDLVCVVPYYSHGVPQGDQVLPFISYGPISFTSEVPFRSKGQKEAFVYKNGVLTFGRSFSNNYNLSFAYELDHNIIAALWSTMNPSQGAAYYHLYEKCDSSMFGGIDNTMAPSNKREVMNRAKQDIIKYYQLDDFDVNAVLVVTWENVEPVSPDGTEQSTFQAVYISGWTIEKSNFDEIVSDEQSAYVIFIYNHGLMKWKYMPGRNVSIGATGKTLNVVEDMDTPLVEQLAETVGNTGYQGVRTYEIGSVGGASQKCYRYICEHSDLIKDPIYEADKRQLYKCPCTLERLGRQWQLYEKRGENQEIQCYAISAVAKQRLLQNNKRNQLCCYKWNRPVTDDWQEVQESWKKATYLPATGHVLINDPWSLSYFDNFQARENMEARKWCCDESSVDLCEKFYTLFPDLNCTNFVEFITASALGDPHITTLDGKTYTINGWGEYILLDIPSENFTLQARTSRAETGNGTLTNATVFTAFAAQESNYSSFQVELASTNTSMVIIVNGIDLTNEFYDQPEFDQSTSTIRVSRESNINRTTVTATFPCGVSIGVHVAVKSLEIEFAVDKSLANMTRGLLGNFNGIIEDEFILPNGTIMDADISDRVIYEQFAEMWRVSDGESVFSYDEGESTKDYQHPEFVPMFRDEADSEAVKEAEAICGTKNDACIFDYLVTRDKKFATSTKQSKEKQDDFTKALKNHPPTVTVTKDNMIRSNLLMVHSGTSQIVQAVATDEDNDSVSVILVGHSPKASVDNSSHKITFTPEIGLMNNLSLQAVDTKGAYSPITEIILVFCSRCSGHGECSASDIQMLTANNMTYLQMTCNCFPAYTGINCESELDGCVSHPCALGQNCTDLTAQEQGNNTIGYKCGPCPQGFNEVNQTCQDSNECLKNDTCEQSCTNTEGSYICSCDTGYRMNHAGKTSCIDINECAERTHNCQQMCLNHRGSYSCSCREGYTINSDGNTCKSDINITEKCKSCEQVCDTINDGAQEVTCSCYTGFKQDPNNKTQCLDINECVEGNRPCSQVCSNTEGGFNCSCYAGYKLAPDGLFCFACEAPYYGKNCADICQCNGRGTCDPVRGCVCNEQWTGIHCENDADECLQPKACPVGQICKNELGSFTCLCPEGFRMTNGICTDINECTTLAADCDLNVQTCENTIGSYICNCKKGFVRSLNSSECKDINECSIQSNVCEQNCINMPGSYNCKCKPGFKLKADRRTCERDKDLCKSASLNCSYGCSIDTDQKPFCFCPCGFQLNGSEICEDTNECQSHNTNLCSYKEGCQNTQGGYNCSCPAGSKLDNDHRTCVSCQGDTWGKECMNSCACSTGASHCDPAIGCVCLSGFTGTKCDQDIDECENGQHHCNQSEICVNLPGNATCRCQEGYHLQQGKCVDFDECAKQSTKNCLQKCDNTEGSFLCSCYHGYFMNTTTNTCTDVDECKLQTDICQQLCINTDGRYKCECESGLFLQRDGFSCKASLPCFENHTCSHECARTGSNQTCFCPKWMALSKDNDSVCEDIDLCSKSSCSEGCIETKQNTSFQCQCSIGKLLTSDGVTCTACLDGTWGENCTHSCNCVITNTQHCDTVTGACDCKSGWQGNNCSTDINECDNSTYCNSRPHSYCVDKPGGASCVCDDGYLNKGNVCQECDDGFYGASCIEKCQCGVHEICNKTNGSCTCSAGWGGNDCEDDVDECQINAHSCDQAKHVHCNNREGGFSCECDTGYSRSCVNCDCEAPETSTVPATSEISDDQTSEVPDTSTVPATSEVSDTQTSAALEVTIAQSTATSEVTPVQTPATPKVPNAQTPVETIVPATLVFDFTPPEAGLSKDSKDYKKYVIQVEKGIFQMLTKAGLPVILVTVTDLRIGSLITDCNVTVNTTQGKHADEAVAIAVIATMNNQSAKINFQGQALALKSIEVKGIALAITDTPCQIREKFNPCSENNPCVEENDVVICRSTDSDDNNLALGLGVSLPAFIILCAAVGIGAYWWSRRQNKQKKAKGEENMGTDDFITNQANLAGNGGKKRQLWMQNPSHYAAGSAKDVSQLPIELTELKNSQQNQSVYATPDIQRQSNPLGAQIESAQFNGNYHGQNSERGDRFFPRYYKD